MQQKYEDLKHKQHEHLHSHVAKGSSAVDKTLEEKLLQNKLMEQHEAELLDLNVGFS